MGIFNRLKQALMIIITTNNNDEIVHSPNSYENDKSDLNRNIALSSPVFDLEGVQMTITQVIFAFGTQKGQIIELQKQNEGLKQETDNLKLELQQFRSGSHQEIIDSKLSETETAVLDLVKENKLDKALLVDKIVLLGKSKSHAYRIIADLLKKEKIKKENNIYIIQ